MKTYDPYFHNDWPRLHPPTATLVQLWQYVEAKQTAVFHRDIQSFFDSMPRHVALVIVKVIVYTEYWFCHNPYITLGYNFNRFIFAENVISKINFAVISLMSFLWCLSWCCILCGEQCISKSVNEHIKKNH